MEIIKAALKLYFMRKQRNNMRVFLKISVFKNFSKFTRKISVPVSCFKANNLIEKEAQAQVFFCKFLRNFRNS